MADFTLNSTGTVITNWAPANIIILNNGMDSDANGFYGNGFNYSVFAHNVAYGLVITATVTVDLSHAVDEIYVCAVVRSGANAGCMIGIQWNFNGGAIIRTTTIAQGNAGSGTNISANLTVPTINNGDVLTCTISISGGTATVTGTQAGSSLAFTGGNTTTTFASEASLAAGWCFSPQNTNATRAAQFTGTGVASTGPTLTPNVGALTLTSGGAPGVLVAEAINPGALTLTGQTPLLSVNIFTGVGGLTTTGVPGTVLGISRLPLVAALTLTGTQAGLGIGLPVSATALTLSGGSSLLNTTITTNTGALITAGALASVVNSGLNTTIAPLVAALTLAGVAGHAGAGIAPLSAALTFTANPPGTVMVPVAVALTLTGFQATVVVQANIARTPLVGALTLTGAAPLVEIVPNAAALLLTGQMPSVGVGVTVFTGAAAFAGNPAGVGITIIPTTGWLYLEFNKPPVSAAAMTLVSYAPFLSFGMTVPAGGLNVTGIQAPSGTDINLTTTAVLTTSGGQPVQTLQAPAPRPGPLVLTGAAPTVTNISSPVVTPLVAALSLTGTAATAQITGNVLPLAGALSLTGLVPSLMVSLSITPGVGALSLSGTSPALGGNGVKGAVGALTLVGGAPGISQTGTNSIIMVQSGTLTTTGQQAGTPMFITTSVGALSLAGVAAAVGGQVAPVTGNVTLTGAVPALSYNLLATTPAVLTLTGATPSVVQGVFITPSVTALTLIGIAPGPGVSPNIISTEQDMILATSVPQQDAGLSIGGDPVDGSPTFVGQAPFFLITLPFSPAEQDMVMDTSQSQPSVGQGVVTATGGMAVKGNLPIVAIGGGSVVYPGPTKIQFLPIAAVNQVSESSNYAAQLSFFDVFGVIYTPVSVQWRVYDDTNKVLLQDWVPLVPAPTIFVNIPATLNEFGNPASLSEVRLVIVQVFAGSGAERNDQSAYTVTAITDLP